MKVCRHLGSCCPPALSQHSLCLSLGSTAETVTRQDNGAIRVHPKYMSQALTAINQSLGQSSPGPPRYLNSFSLFPRRSRTSQWELKASWGGMPQRMMAFRNALRCRALKPRTCREVLLDHKQHLGASQLLQLSWTTTSTLRLSTESSPRAQGILAPLHRSCSS